MPPHPRHGTMCAMVALAAIALAARAGAAQSAGDALDTSRPVTYFIASGVPDSGFRPTDRQLAQWALESWQRNAGGQIRIEPAPEAEALVRVYWAGASDGTYGEMRPLTVGGRHGAAVFIRPDMEALGPELAARTSRDPLMRESIVYLTCLHELGHALGLSHTSDFRDIMYFFGYGGDILEYFDRYRGQLASRADIATASGLSPSDIRRLQTLYNKPAR